MIESLNSLSFMVRMVFSLLQDYAMEVGRIERHGPGLPLGHPRPHRPGNIDIADTQFIAFFPGLLVEKVKGFIPLGRIGNRKSLLGQGKQLRVIVQPTTVFR